MSQFYKVLKADPLGEPWTPNFADAKAIQNYWCQVEGEELAVSIGKQVPNVVTPGESVYGDLMKATSQKGTEYWKFKSAKVPDGVDRPATTAVAQPVGDGMPAWFIPTNNMIEYIYKELKKMDSDSEPEQMPNEPSTEPVGEEAQTQLDDIFPPETPEEAK